MDWQMLISSKRLGQEEAHLPKRDDRTEFQRDYDRLIFSAPFRRLQNKTQVFPLPGSVFVHNRLTHSLEVSSVGRSLGTDSATALVQRHPELTDSHIGEIGSIVSAACLAHDLGNPPFGHSGEKAINAYFSEGNGLWLRDVHLLGNDDHLTDTQWYDLTHFEGNANAFRLLTHQFCGRRKGGFVMTYSTLASIVKYPFSSHFAGSHGKFGFFASEQADYLKIADELGIICKQNNEGRLIFARHPLVYLVEAADDICYEIMDIEDAHKLRILTTQETKDLFLGFFDEVTQDRILKRLVDASVTDVNEQIVFLRSCVIGCLEHECVAAFLAHEDEILAGNFQSSLIESISQRPREAYLRCVDTAYGKIYHSKEVVDIELAGFKVISSLIDVMMEAVMHPEKTYSKLLINRVSDQYEIHAPTLYGKAMAVLDYISGMTDVFALDLYRKVNGISLPLI